MGIGVGVLTSSVDGRSSDPAPGVDSSEDLSVLRDEFGLPISRPMALEQERRRAGGALIRLQAHGPAGVPRKKGGQKGRAKGGRGWQDRGARRALSARPRGKAARPARSGQPSPVGAWPEAIADARGAPDPSGALRTGTPGAAAGAGGSGHGDFGLLHGHRIFRRAYCQLRPLEVCAVAHIDARPTARARDPSLWRLDDLGRLHLDPFHPKRERVDGLAEGNRDLGTWGRRQVSRTANGCGGKWVRRQMGAVANGCCG